MKHKFERSHGQLGIGIFLLLAGIALLLDKFDILSVGPAWHFWPIIIIAIGLGHLIDAHVAEEYRKAIWLLFLGCWLLISQLHLFGLSFHNSWPILLIGVGVGMLWKSSCQSHYKFVKDHCHGN
jgi:hypothetical protein